jgi:glutamate--cysteine ligase
VDRGGLQAKSPSSGSAPSTRSSRSRPRPCRRSPYEGRAASARCSKACRGCSAGSRSWTRGNIIGLYDVTGGGAISLEPGGQFELVRRAAGNRAPDLHRTDGASRAGAGRSPAARDRLPRPRHEPEMDAERDPGDAEGPLPDHDALHAEGRQSRPRHDVPDLHGADQSRLLVRSRHGEEAAGVAGAAAGRDRAVRQLALHRGASPTASSRSAPEIWRDTDNDRSGMLPFAFEDGMGSSAMSITRSTCRCISSSAATTYHRRRRLLVPRPVRRQAEALPGERADHVGLGQPSSRRSSPRCA